MSLSMQAPVAGERGEGDTLKGVRHRVLKRTVTHLPGHSRQGVKAAPTPRAAGRARVKAGRWRHQPRPCVVRVPEGRSDVGGVGIC